MIQVMVAAPKASPPIVRNKLNMIFSPFFRISDITVFLSHDSVMQTMAKPAPVPTTVDMISVATRAVKPNIFIFSFHSDFLFSFVFVVFFSLYTIYHVFAQFSTVNIITGCSLNYTLGAICKQSYTSAQNCKHI